MSIIIEGVDGIGKTTKALKMINDWPKFKYVHNWVKPKKALEIQSEANKELLLAEYGKHIIFDRSYIISEYVYANVLGRETSILLYMVQDFVNLLAERDSYICFMLSTNISGLILDDCDKTLPIQELNNYYHDLFTNKLRVPKDCLDIIEVRQVGEKG